MRCLRECVACIVVGLSLAACSSAVYTADRQRGPDGIAERVGAIRFALARADTTTAQKRVAAKDAGSGDALLRELERGIVALYAGDPRDASTAFDRAYWMDEARATHSISNGAATLVTSDWALPYRPGATERAMLHIHSALAWLEQGNRDEAAVDARRLSALLVALDEKKAALPTDLTKTLHRAAAALFAAAGLEQDAAVSLRWAADGDAGVLTGDTSVEQGSGHHAYATDESAPDSATAEVVLFVSRGFVTHRAGQTLWLALADGDFAALARTKDGDDEYARALTILDRRARARPCEWSRRAVCGYDRGVRGSGDLHGVAVSWPELRAPRRATTELTIALSDTAITLDPGIGASVSEGIAEDFSHDAPARLARAATRAVAREALIRASEAAFEKANGDGKKNKDKKERLALNLLGAAGAAATVASFAAERADTRSWALLPEEFVVRSVRLRPGTYVVRRDGASGAIVETVTLRAGETRVVPVRDWSAGPPRAARHE